MPRPPALPMLLLMASAVLGCGDGTPPTPTPTSPVDANQSSGPGDDAYKYLTDSPFSRVYVEIDYVADDDPSDGLPAEPNPEAISYLLSWLDGLCNKSGGFTYNPADSDVIPVPTLSDGSPKRNYTYDEVNALEVQYRDHYHEGAEAVLYFLYVNGEYVTDAGEATSVIGFAHHGSSMAVFKGQVNSARTAEGRRIYEQSVVVHEVGHLLGLVTAGIPAVNPSHVDNDPDTGRGVHCTNQDCLMYWSVGTLDVLQGVVSGQIPDLDQDCRNDLAAAGGKETTASRPVPAFGRSVASPHATDPHHPNIVF